MSGKMFPSGIAGTDRRAAASLRGRQTYPGPVAGALTVVSFGPAILTSVAKKKTFTFQFPFDMRVVAVGWYCRLDCTAATLSAATDDGLGVGAGRLMLNAGATTTIDIHTNPSGVAVYDGTYDAVEVAWSYDSAVGSLTGQSPAAGGWDIKAATPNIRPYTPAEGYFKCGPAAISGGEDDVLDLCIQIYGYPVGHINADSAND